MPSQAAAPRLAPPAPRGFDRTPPALVVDGEFQLGTFAQPIPRVNPLDAVPAAMRWWHALRLKEWQAFQAMDAEYFLVGAVYATKVIDLLQVAVIEKKTGQMRKWQRKVAPRQLRVAQGLNGTTSSGRAGGMSLTVMNDIPRGRLRIDASAAARADLPELTLSLEGHCAQEQAGHLVICHPFPSGKVLYSHKCIMPGAGDLAMGPDRHGFDAMQTALILDDHKGFYPIPMAYDWLTAAARDGNGRVLGFNLTANQIRDPERFNENALWLGASVERLPAVRFERPQGVYGTWHVTDREGRVDVRFAPTVRNEVHVGPGRMLAEYYGPFGWVEGTIARGDGATVKLDGLFGMGEQKRIRM
jgi:hypothetical protein